MSTSQVTPDQAKFMLNWSLPSLKNEHQTTKRVIEAIPVDKGDYRPDSICKTALELAWHIVASEKRFLGGIAAGAFDFTPMPRPESIKNSAGIVTLFDESFAASFERLQARAGGRTESACGHHGEILGNSDLWGRLATRASHSRSYRARMSESDRMW